MKQTGIYQLRNKVNGKKYIGKAVDIKVRINKHFTDLANETHHNEPLQEDFQKYGIDNFEVTIIEECDAFDLERKESEHCYVNDVWNPEKGYNIGKLLDFRHLSKEDAIFYKNKFLSKLLGNVSHPFDFSIYNDTEIFGLNYTQIRIFLKEITFDDEKKYGCFLNVKFDFYERKTIVGVTLFNSEDNIYVETKEISDKIDYLDNKDSLTQEEELELVSLEKELEEKYLHNLNLLLNKVPLREKIKTLLIEEFVFNNIKTILTDEEVSHLDLIEDYIELFLFDDDIDAAKAFCSVVNSFSYDTLYLDNRFE